MHILHRFMDHFRGNLDCDSAKNALKVASGRKILKWNKWLVVHRSLASCLPKGKRYPNWSPHFIKKLKRYHGIGKVFGEKYEMTNEMFTKINFGQNERCEKDLQNIDVAYFQKYLSWIWMEKCDEKVSYGEFFVWNIAYSVAICQRRRMKALITLGILR
jgi:hypothetical protein